MYNAKGLHNHICIKWFLADDKNHLSKSFS